ncbi:MAG: winged helix-turn-helix domain-containing protein [Eubacteriales bacterium]
MKFKFYPTESRLYDFLEFPAMVYARRHFEESKEEEDRKVPAFTDYMEFVSRTETKLKPYQKEIDLFYMENFLGDYDLIGLISKLHTIVGYQTEKQYLDRLLELSGKEIHRSIAYSLLSIHENTPEYSDAIMRKAESLTENKGELLAVIKELPTEAASKWNLFLIVEEPVKYMKMYVELMRSMLPIFAEVYEPFEREVSRYGRYLEAFLNQNGAKGLEELTCSILDANIISHEKNRLFISAMHQFAISILDAGPSPFIAWGLRVEEGFKRTKEENENKVNERVRVFKNLGDKTRYDVLRLIASGVSSMKEIALATGVSGATISYHVNNLLQAKIVKLDRTDNKYRYTVDHQFIEKLLDGLKEDLKNPK